MHGPAPAEKVAEATLEPSSSAWANQVTNVFLPTRFAVLESLTERPGSSSCSMSELPVLTMTSIAPGVPGSPTAESWYAVPGTAALTVAPKSLPCVRERATWIAPWPVQAAHRRSLESSESAMCGSPPPKAAWKVTPSPAGWPPRNGTTANAVAVGLPGGQAMNVLPDLSETSGTRSECTAVGASEVGAAGLRSAASGSRTNAPFAPAFE